MQVQSVAYVLDPRFRGGTSAAVAQELLAIAPLVRPQVCLIQSAMFRGRTIAPVLEAALQELRIVPVWEPPQIAAEAVILHNPVFLKFDPSLAARIVARRLIVVTHENLLRPGGAEAFDVGHCLDVIERASLCLSRELAPVSGWNRRTVEAWLARQAPRSLWRVIGQDWFNICELPVQAARTPSDRRGRHSRPGLEKFPPLVDMDTCFPATSEANVILGADAYLAEGLVRPHWEMHAFNAIDVQDYFDRIDFLIHFTAPTYQESFGRVMAEGLAAGKVVISDPQTAAAFQGAVIGARPHEVDAIIARMIADPTLYRAQVALGHRWLADQSAARFAARFRQIFDVPQERAA